jgi:hypothetical protein
METYSILRYWRSTLAGQSACGWWWYQPYGPAALYSPRQYIGYSVGIYYNNIAWFKINDHNNDTVWNNCILNWELLNNTCNGHCYMCCYLWDKRMLFSYNVQKCIQPNPSSYQRQFLQLYNSKYMCYMNVTYNCDVLRKACFWHDFHAAINLEIH